MAVPGSRSALPHRVVLSSSSRAICYNCGNPGHSAHDCTVTKALGAREKRKKSEALAGSSSKTSRFKPPPPPGAPPLKPSTLTQSDAQESGDLPKRLFVGNLSMDVTEGDILKVFGKIGNVASCAWLHHFGGPRRGQPKGFCFVEMKTRAEGQAAIDALNGRRLRGRELRINFAKDEAEPSDDLTKLASSSTASKAAADDHHHRPQVNEATLDRRAAMVKQTLLGMGVPLPPRPPPGPAPTSDQGAAASAETPAAGGPEPTSISTADSSKAGVDRDDDDVVSSILNDI